MSCPPASQRFLPAAVVCHCHPLPISFFARYHVIQVAHFKAAPPKIHFNYRTSRTARDGLEVYGICDKSTGQLTLEHSSDSTKVMFHRYLRLMITTTPKRYRRNVMYKDLRATTPLHSISLPRCYQHALLAGIMLPPSCQRLTTLSR